MVLVNDGLVGCLGAVCAAVWGAFQEVLDLARTAKTGLVNGPGSTVTMANENIDAALWLVETMLMCVYVFV